ncbi:MAG: glycerol dehydrogenase [Alkalibacterium sp.]|nr:glycerol dehydrogenase [Alkalibacterium sp.]
MDKIFVSPNRYIQGKDLVHHAAQYMDHFGEQVIVLADDFVQDLAANELIENLSETFKVTKVTFNGECSMKEINRISDIAKEKSVDFILGMGAGKALDTAKAVADMVKVPIVVFPTLASTDAPTSGLSVVYTEDGAFDQYLFYKKNPDLVLMDTAIIAGAPARMMASGISDAMATLVEARAVKQKNGNTMSGGKATISGFAIAEKCEEVLFDYGVLAYESNKQNVVTPALEAIVEANTLLSGLGFEDSGLAAAHAIHNGFTAVDGDIHHLTHGEKVAYGTLTQLVLENKTIEEIDRYLEMYIALDLPVTLEQMHLDDKTHEELLDVGKSATKEGETMDNMPFVVTPEDVVEAIRAVDVYAKSYMQRKK